MRLTETEKARRQAVCNMSWMDTRRQVLAYTEPELLCAIARFTLEQLMPLGLVVERAASEVFTAARTSRVAQGVCTDLRDTMTGGEASLWVLLAFEHRKEDQTCVGRLVVAVTPTTTQVLDVLEQRQTGYELACHATKLSHAKGHSAMPYCVRKIREQYSRFWRKESRFAESTAGPEIQQMLEKLGQDFTAVMAL